MKPFIEMDPELARKAIEGYTNVLAPEQRALEAFYRHQSCPKCGGESLQKEISPNHAFSDPDTLVPRALLRCTFCRCLFDPHSNIVVELGEKGIMPIDVPSIYTK